MITDSTQRKIPKRRDRFNLLYLLFFGVAVLPFLAVFVPAISDVVLEYITMIYVFFILVLALGINLYQWWTWQKAWRTFAESSGLAYENYKSRQSLWFKWPRVTGVYRGYGLRIESFTRGSGRNKKTYTLIKISLRGDVEKRLEISPRTWLSGAKSSFLRGDRELQTIQLGTEPMDKKLEVKTGSESFARNVLSSFSIQQGLLEVRSQAPDMKIKVQGKELYYHERTTIKDGAYLAAVIQTLIEFASYVERYGMGFIR